MLIIQVEDTFKSIIPINTPTLVRNRMEGDLANRMNDNPANTI